MIIIASGPCLAIISIASVNGRFDGAVNRLVRIIFSNFTFMILTPSDIAPKISLVVTTPETTPLLSLIRMASFGLLAKLAATDEIAAFPSTTKCSSVIDISEIVGPSITYAMCRMFINFALDGRQKYVLAPCRLIMADETEIRKGERIPRRPLPQFDEVEGGLMAAISRDGLFGTALDDRNQYGPHGMIILLFVVALATGTLLYLLR
jgi:hypothetical protein